MSGKYVYTFGDGKAEGDASMKLLLGGKGATVYGIRYMVYGIWDVRCRMPDMGDGIRDLESGIRINDIMQQVITNIRKLSKIFNLKLYLEDHQSHKE